MTVRRSPATPKPSDPQRLPLRWFVVVIAGAGSFFAGHAASGPVGGLFLACAVVGLLHAILE